MAVGELVVSLLAETGSFETDTKRAADTLVKLEKIVKQLQKTMADSRQYADDFVGPLQPSKLRPAIDGVENLNRAVQKSQAGFRASNQVLQQASYQVTDFVIQVSGGVSALRAFGQQAPQLLAAFGGGGALAGVFIALGAGIADLIMKFGGVKSIDDAIKELKTSTQGLTDASNTLTNVDLSSLGKAYREANREGKDLIDANVRLGKLLVEISMIDATAGFKKGIKEALNDIDFFAKAIGRIRDAFANPLAVGPRTDTQDFASAVKITQDQAAALDTARIAFGNGQKTAAEYKNTLSGILEQYKGTNKQLTDFIVKENERIDVIDASRKKLEAFNNAQENGYRGLEKASKEGDNFIQALRERTKRTEEGEIAMLRMQAAEKGVAAQAAPLIALLKEANWAKGTEKFEQSLAMSTQQMQFQNSLIGKSAVEVQVLNAQYKIYTDLQKQIQDLTRANGELSTAEIEKMKAAAESAIAIQTAMITSRQQQQQTFQAGFQGGLQNYVDTAGNLAKNMENAFSNAFKGMEDGLTRFVLTGKASFTDFANALISDIMRIYIRMALTGLVQNFAIPAFSTTPGTSSNPAYQGPPSAPVRGYADGGYTGDGGKYQPAGIVHAGEFVMNKQATSRIGVGNLYRMMRGYADGGYVGPTPTGTGNGNVSIVVNNNSSNAQATATSRTDAFGNRQIEIMVADMVNKAIATGKTDGAMRNAYNIRRSGK